MTNYTNKMLLRHGKRWQIDELDDGELGEQKCTQKVGILLGPTKKWRIKRIDKLNDDEIDEFYCILLTWHLCDKLMGSVIFFYWNSIFCAHFKIVIASYKVNSLFGVL